MNRFAQATHVLLRVVVGFLFFEHGGQKLFGLFGGLQGPGGPMGAPPVGSLMWFAGVVECVGGLLIFIGLLTRPAAFLAAGEMAIACFKQHAPHGVWPIQNHGELAALYCFVFLFFVAHGAGKVSFDALFKRRPRGDMMG